MSAVASIPQISIYGIATDDYVSFKLLIINVFVPAVLLLVKARESYCTRSSRARVTRVSSMIYLFGSPFSNSVHISLMFINWSKVINKK